MKDLSHVDKRGSARMVDVSKKAETAREAKASGYLSMDLETLNAIESGSLKKGDVLAVARVAGINAAKATSSLIPLCHNIILEKVEVDFHLEEFEGKGRIGIYARSKTTGKTGVEMEALTACSIAALTLYDMCKSIDRGMTISNISLDEKKGGKSGEWKR